MIQRARVRRTVAAAAAILLLASVAAPSFGQQPTKAEKTGPAPKSLPQIPAPDPRAAVVPRGYRVEILAKGLTYPTSIEFDGRGNVFIAEAGYSYGDPVASARILMISEQGGPIRTIADGLSGTGQRPPLVQRSPVHLASRQSLDRKSVV